MPADIGGREREVSWGDVLGEDIHDPLKMGVREFGVQNPTTVFCYRARDEPGGLDVKEQRER